MSVEEPDPPVIAVGKNAAVKPAGIPVAESETVDVNPALPVTETDDVVEVPAVSDSVAGLDDIVKSGLGVVPATAFTAAYAFSFPAPQAFGSGFVLV